MGRAFVDVANGIISPNGTIQRSASRIESLILNDNPDIGPAATREIVSALARNNNNNLSFQHVELRNIGAGNSTAIVLAEAMRGAFFKWHICDISCNNIGRDGLNELMWALRVNRTLRVFKCGDNKPGVLLGSHEDMLGLHGFSINKMILTNVSLYELDLSRSGITSVAAIQIFDAMIDNYSIKKINLRDNLLDDNVSVSLFRMLLLNDLLEVLNLGSNNMGYSCCLSLAAGLEKNHAIKKLYIDYNKIANASTEPFGELCRALNVNLTLRYLNLDGNELGPDCAALLTATLCRNNSLNVISIRNNKLDGTSGMSLVKAYAHSGSLKNMILTKDEVGVNAWDFYQKIVTRKLAHNNVL